MAVKCIGCTSSATVTGDKLAISEMSGALAMQGRALAMEGSALAMHGGALAMHGGALAMQGRALAMEGSALAMHGGALAMQGGALAMQGGALAMDGAALSMDGVNMHRCVVRPVGGAHKLAEVEVVVVCNLTPAFASFELAHDRVEALARCVGEQVCIVQATVVKPRR